MKFWRRHDSTGITPTVGGVLALPLPTQILLGAGTAIILIASFVMTQSLLGFAAILGILLLWFVVRSPILSLFAFIVINVVLTLRPKADTIGGAPSTLDLLLGLCLAAIIGYWIVRIRIIEWQPLSTSVGQLCMVLFFVWAAFTTLGGILFNYNPVAVGLREYLNLLPFLILPVLYERYIKPDSKQETKLFALVLVAGFIIILWNIIVFRSNVARAFYLYQTGRTALDLEITCFVILLMTSFLMAFHRWYISLFAILFLLLGVLGLVVSFTRTLYVGVLLTMGMVLLFGRSEERWRGIKHLFSAGLAIVISMIPIYYSSKIIRLLLSNFALRFLSTQHFGTDRSLLSRISEWKSEWHYIVGSPVFGYGFGASFRFYNILEHSHSWMPFSHNSYLYIIFKTGFVGGFLFIISMVALLYKGFHLIQSPELSPRSRIVIRACVAFISLVLFGAFTGPTFDSKTNIAWLAFAWGYILAVERSAKNSRLVKAPFADRPHILQK